MRQFTKNLSRPSVLACACSSLLLATVAQAQESNPYYAGGTLRTTSNSNIYLASAAQALSDKITAVGLQTGVDQSFGRQRVVIDASVNNNIFAKYTKNNHADYSLSGKLDWETIERLSGTLTVGSSQSRYVDPNASATSSDLNLLRSTNMGLQARLGNVTALTFEGGLSLSQNRYSAAAYQSSNLSQLAMNGGVRFRPMGGISLWTGLRHTNGRYPNYYTGADEVRRNDIDLIGDARFTGASSVNARLSMTRESHSALAARDYRSWTGGLGWNWQPTGKLKLGLNMGHDSNVGAIDYAFNLIATNDSQISTRINLTAELEITSILNLTAGWSDARRTLDNSLTVSGNSAVRSGKDNTTVASLGLRYTPLRNAELGCSLAVTDRTTSEAETSTVTYPYHQRLLSCYGQLQLR
jgi:hypothetical protein